MSKHETPLTLAYWEKVGGTLIEEYPIVLKGDGCSRRLVDGLIIRGGERKRLKPYDRNSIDLTGFNERKVITPLGGSDPAWSPLMH